jgi:hypothetical protein
LPCESETRIALAAARLIWVPRILSLDLERVTNETKNNRHFGHLSFLLNAAFSDILSRQHDGAFLDGGSC